MWQFPEALEGLGSSERLVGNVYVPSHGQTSWGEIVVVRLSHIVSYPVFIEQV